MQQQRRIELSTMRGRGRIIEIPGEVERQDVDREDPGPDGL
jgi:hypothetical protein